MKPIIATLLTMAALSGAQAQTLYRCGNAYSQAPCAQAKIVEVGDERSAAQQAQARRVAAGERRLAAEMRRDRLADERAAGATAAASLSGHPAAKLALVEVRRKKKHTTARPSPPTDFIAYDPGSRQRRGN